ncbi:expressed unknown protein [Seminavis robusta]|uniref:Uncharacterized protein n=1 Tax=Seminavis robusta TaxID=568900 RepID=A0A9N8HL78_9STRA|nr:expressed unknown protein [Seminavis robusta]|eukprot:Sro1008_g230600.1 n/a (179) ;mRNA; f:29262-29940
MKQVSHAEALVAALVEREKEDDKELEQLLISQLSHSDGIRGFFVTYLTGETSPADNPTVPIPLQKAMSQVSPEELVPLACMNVVMPTGTMSMHQDPTLSEQSKKTSVRGSRILASLLNGGSPRVKDNCQAILAVATDKDESEADPELIKYWTAFFEKWGYKEPQRKDIALAITEILEE